MGCLVAYRDDPKRIYMISVGHGLLHQGAARGDPIVSDLDRTRVIGRLENWATFTEEMTADVALVWIDPTQVSAGNAGMGSLKGENRAPAPGTGVRLYKSVPGSILQGQVPARRETITIPPIVCNDWQTEQAISYLDQMACTPVFNFAGSSGAVVIDPDNRVVGMAVAVDTIEEDGHFTTRTVVTPIAAILDHEELGKNLVIVTKIPSGAIGPN